MPQKIILGAVGLVPSRGRYQPMWHSLGTRVSIDPGNFIFWSMLLKPSFSDRNLGKASRSQVWAAVQGLLGNIHLFTMEAVLSGFKQRFGDRLTLQLTRKLSGQTASSISPDLTFFLFECLILKPDPYTAGCKNCLAVQPLLRCGICWGNTLPRLN